MAFASAAPSRVVSLRIRADAQDNFAALVWRASEHFVGRLGLVERNDTAQLRGEFAVLE